MEEILKMALNYGLMTSLFVSLLIWVLKDSQKREKKYQSMIDKLHKSLEIVADIQEETKQISYILTNFLIKRNDKREKGGKDVKTAEKHLE
ncbi:MAG: hypothetical protein LBH47_01365 [Christensenellaceae bacterium]|jgi:Na+-transporting NADH:ubiquinone oxidoreductase subunit NqrC|nr:hypothetical protein [Christensenellaceae bacterium]